MSTDHLSPAAVVATVNGKAWARSQDGSMRFIQEGDVIYEGEVVVTADGARVDLQLPDGSLYPVEGQLFAALDVPEGDDEAASQESGDADDGMSENESPSGNIPDGVGASDEIVWSYSVQSDSSTGSVLSDEPSGYLRLANNQNIEEIQMFDGGNDFVLSPVLSVSIVGGYSDGAGGRAGGYDEFLDGRATYNPRLLEGTDLLRLDDDLFEAELRPFDGWGRDDDYVNRVPVPLADAAEVVEGGNVVSGNVLDNDGDGNGTSTVISITYVPEGGGDPVTEEVPAGGSAFVDSIYG